MFAPNSVPGNASGGMQGVAYKSLTVHYAIRAYWYNSYGYHDRPYLSISAQAYQGFVRSIGTSYERYDCNWFWTNCELVAAA